MKRLFEIAEPAQHVPFPRSTALFGHAWFRGRLVDNICLTVALGLLGQARIGTRQFLKFKFVGVIFFDLRQRVQLCPPARNTRFVKAYVPAAKLVRSPIHTMCRLTYRSSCRGGNYKFHPSSRI